MEKKSSPINELANKVGLYETSLYNDGGLRDLTNAGISSNYSIGNLEAAKKSLSEIVDSLSENLKNLIGLLKNLEVTDINQENGLLGLTAIVLGNMEKILKKMKKVKESSNLQQILNRVIKCCKGHTDINHDLLFNRYWIDIALGKVANYKSISELEQQKSETSTKLTKMEETSHYIEDILPAFKCFAEYLENPKSEKLLKDVQVQLAKIEKYKGFDKYNREVPQNIDMIIFLHNLYRYNIKLISDENKQKLKKIYFGKLLLSKLNEDKKAKTVEKVKTVVKKEPKYVVPKYLVRRLILSCTRRLRLANLLSELCLEGSLLTVDENIGHYINQKLDRYNYLDLEGRKEIEKLMGECIDCKYKLYYIKHLHLLNYKNSSENNFFAVKLDKLDKLDKSYIEKHNDIINKLKKNEKEIDKIFENFSMKIKKKRNTMKILKWVCNRQKFYHRKMKMKDLENDFQTYFQTYLKDDKYYLDDLNTLTMICDNNAKYKYHYYTDSSSDQPQLNFRRDGLKNFYKQQIEVLQSKKNKCVNDMKFAERKLTSIKNEIDTKKHNLANQFLQKYLVYP